ncbi:hypothetical protein ACJIZ3_007438 [Penstemon smallii]|uniref:Uncharacterized protein n=1 Tax=Penstemon smallii TaxID=265156 RepID=A0ABD3SB26_9LAMI
MSITLSTVHSKTPVKFCKPNLLPRIHNNYPLSSCFLTMNKKPSNKLKSTHNFYGPFKNTFNGLNSAGFIVKAQNESGFNNNMEKEEFEARGQSSMPERFRYLTKEAPDKPLRWPWLIVSAFMLYAWRTVLWELSNWKNTVQTIFRFVGYISKLILALIFHFIGDPITSLIRGFETTLYTIRAFYSSIINYAPIQELTTIIILTSSILAIAQAAVPDSVNSQPYLLTVAGLIGFAAVKNYISELFFWTLLIGLFGYAKLVKKRDYVTSALPLAAVLAAVGEPWVRVIVIFSYLGMAILQYSRGRLDVEGIEEMGGVDRVPAPLVCAALAIGVRVAAKWAGYRHLTWMVV